MGVASLDGRKDDGWKDGPIFEVTGMSPLSIYGAHTLEYGIFSPSIILSAVDEQQSKVLSIHLCSIGGIAKTLIDVFRSVLPTFIGWPRRSVEKGNQG